MSYYDEVKTADSLIEELRTRIAELEAEVKDHIEREYEQRQRAREAEAEVAALTETLRLAATDWAKQWYPSPEWDCRAAERITYLRIRAERSTP